MAGAVVGLYEGIRAALGGSLISGLDRSRYVRRDLAVKQFGRNDKLRLGQGRPESLKHVHVGRLSRPSG